MQRQQKVSHGFPLQRPPLYGRHLKHLKPKVGKNIPYLDRSRPYRILTLGRSVFFGEKAINEEDPGVGLFLVTCELLVEVSGLGLL